MADCVFSSEAESDLRGIIRYTAKHFGLAQARAYPAQLKQAAQTAANFPSIARSYTTQQGQIFQQYNVGRHALFYQPTETGIFVVRILHLMMKFDRHLD